MKKPTKPAKKIAPARSAAGKTRPATAKTRPAPPATPKFGRRADLGAPVDGFFAKQPPNLRAILDELRAMVGEAAPDASSAIKWGMPLFTVGGQIVCAMAGFKSHVNLILPGPPGTYADPDGRLAGDGKTGKHLKVRALDELPTDVVRGWLRTAAARARAAKT